MKCDANSFFNENVGDCFSCSDICDNLRATGNSRENCLIVCPDYTPTHPAETNSGSHYTPTHPAETNSGSHLKIILPVIALVLSISVIIGLIIRTKYHRRHRLNVPRVLITQTQPLQSQPLQWTTEEVGDDPRDDSGIDTTRVYITNVSTEQEDSQIDRIHIETQTGLSELPCNSRFLRNASDASGAQAVI